jgi:hypothetical protein
MSNLRWKISQKSGANAALASTGLPALPNQRYCVTAIRFYIQGANIAADSADRIMTIKDGDDVVWEAVFAPGQLRGGSLNFALTAESPMQMSYNKALTFNCTAGGAGCIIGINAVGFIE